MKFNFGSDFEIPKHRDIYIIGAGVSLDLFDKTKLDRNEMTIITCNGTISYPNCSPHFQVCGDTHALDFWSKHPNNSKETLWIARPAKIGQMAKLKLNFVDSRKLFLRAESEYFGTGEEAFNLAYYLDYYYPVENIYYLGYDYTRVRIENKLYWYAATSQCMDYQKEYQVPTDWRSKKYTLELVDGASYSKQLDGLAKCIATNKKFCAKLRSLSFCDISRLNYRKIHSGYDEAKGKGGAKL